MGQSERSDLKFSQGVEGTRGRQGLEGPKGDDVSLPIQA